MPSQVPNPSSAAVVDQPDVDASIADTQLLWSHLSNASIATVRCDVDGTIEWASPSAFTVLGYTPLDLSGRSIDSLLDDDTRPAVASRLGLDGVGAT